MRRRYDAIVHPLSLSSSGHDTSTPKVREMARNLWLRLLEDLDKVTDTNFLLSHEVEEPQAGVVAQSLKEALYVEALLCCHVLNISALTNV